MSLKLVSVLYAALFLFAAQSWPAAGIGYRAQRSPAGLTRSTSASSAASAKLRKPRLPLRAHRTATAPASPTAPRLLTPPATGSRIAVFNGLNKPGLSAVDNGPNQESPPDTTGSIGPNHYVEMTNSVIGVYNRSDLSLVSQAPFTSWLNVGPVAAPCDPQMQWDTSAQRWLYVVLGCNFGVDTLFFGWSKTADPSDLVSGWCEFNVSTPGVLSDYPKLGHNNNYMLVGVNDFSDGPGNPFVTAQIFWMNTPAVGDTSCTPPTVKSEGTPTKPLLNGDGTWAATPVPVNTTTNAANGYVVSPYDPSSVPQNKLAVWHLDSNGGLYQDRDIIVNTYAVPKPAPNLGGFGIDTLDGRLTQAVGDPTTGIYTQHTVNGTGNRSKVTWYEIQVASSVPKLTQEGDIASTTDSVFNGSISPRSDGEGAAIFYNRSSATTDPVIAARIRMTSTPIGQMEPGEIVLATSSAGDNDFSCNYQGTLAPCRWGDYSGASPDPVSRSVVWGSNQALTSPSTPTPNWVTENYAILVPPTRLVQQASPAPSPTSRSPVIQSAPPTPTSRPSVIQSSAPPT